MLNHITTYLNTRLLTTGYFTRLFEFVELKPQKERGVAPMYYCKGEYVDVTDFDTANGTSYIRLRSPISITERSNTHVSGETLLNISYPLRVVGVVKNSHLSDNNSFRSVNLAQDISMALTNTLAIQLNAVLKSRSVDILATGLNTDSVSVVREEMPDVSERYEYTFAAVDINVNIEITQDCYEDACSNTGTSCTLLLASLTTQEKNECILPAYDFSNESIQESLTAQQITDITAWLFPGANVQININGAAWSTEACGNTENIPVQNTLGTSLGSKIGSNWEIPDTTFNVYVGGVLTSTTTQPT